MGHKGNELLLNIYNKIWKEKQVSEDWRALIVPIYNKIGDSNDCNNYRGISLLCTTMKILQMIIDKRLRTVIEDNLNESRLGLQMAGSFNNIFLT